MEPPAIPKVQSSHNKKNQTKTKTKKTGVTNYLPLKYIAKQLQPKQFGIYINSGTRTSGTEERPQKYIHKFVENWLSTKH